MSLSSYIENIVLTSASPDPLVFQSVDAKIIILAKEMAVNTAFDPSTFFGSTHVSKKEIDAYLNASKDEWQVDECTS